MHSPTWISRFSDKHPPSSFLSRPTGPFGRRRRGRASAARWSGSEHRRAGRREPRLEACPGGQRTQHATACSTRTTRSDTQSAPECSTTRWRRSHSAGNDPRHQALRDTVTELLSMDEPGRHIASMITGLDVHYDLGEGPSLIGRRMPDLDLATADGPTRVFTLLNDAEGLLLPIFGEPGRFEISQWADHVHLVDAEYEGMWQLPVLGEHSTPPEAVLCYQTRWLRRLGRRHRGPRTRELRSPGGSDPGRLL